jgi:hypothetical protein
MSGPDCPLCLTDSPSLRVPFEAVVDSLVAFAWEQSSSALLPGLVPSHSQPRLSNFAALVH